MRFGEYYNTMKENEEWGEEEMEDDYYALYVSPDESLEVPDDLSERVLRKRVIRGGKKVLKFTTDRQGYRVKRDGNRAIEVRIDPAKARKISLNQRKAAKKRRTKQTQANRKRKLSLKRRTW